MNCISVSVEVDLYGGSILALGSLEALNRSESPLHSEILKGLGTMEKALLPIG